MSTNEELVMRIQAGDNVPANMEILYNQTYKLIYLIAKRYSGFEELEDLLQVGYIALDAAAGQFRPDGECLFSTYLVSVLKRQFIRHIETSGRVVRVASGEQLLIRKYKRIQSWYAAEYNRPATDTEACYSLHINAERLQDVKKAIKMQSIGSLDIPVTEDADAPLLDVVAGTTDTETEVTEREDFRNMSADLWSTVKQIDTDGVITSIFRNGQTSQQIADDRGYKLSTVNIRKRRTLRELKRLAPSHIYGNYWHDYIESYSMRGSFRRFVETGSSSTEYAAMKLIDEQERQLRIWQQDNSIYKRKV